MVTTENSRRHRNFAFHFIWYAAFLAVVPQILMAALWAIASRIEGFDFLQLPITFYCMPAALLFGQNGGGHFYLHAQVFPADFIGWAAVFCFWLAVSACLALVHYHVCRHKETA